MSFFKLPDQTTTYYDIDDTLILYRQAKTEENKNDFIEIEDLNHIIEVLVHKKHVQSMKDNKKAGHNIIVWSAGGSDWAAQVIKTLELSEYVDIIINKPDFWYDDLESTDILHPEFRIWKEPK